ncbi:MAG TPA: FecR domain-containing protein [Tepidisphaeraceae bacterium]|nr:FecR domain-containing protein [Tepidisphaeraceae bacterium]
MTDVPTDDELADLIDGYLDDALDAAQFARLEAALRADTAARERFVRYAQVHTDLHAEAKAHRAAGRALAALGAAGAGAVVAPVASTPARRGRPPRWWRPVIATAASVIVAVALTWAVARRQVSDPVGVPVGGPATEVAWLTNAQDSRWAAGAAPGANMAAGCVLRLDAGLAEFRLQSGPTVVLQAPATVELRGPNAVRLVAGRLTAAVPEAARGFEVLTPHARVVDLGTEFGVAVAADGSADVVVFQGKVEVVPAPGGGPAVALSANDTARVAVGGVRVNPAERRADAASFVRRIPAAQAGVPRTLAIDFGLPAPGTLMDASGVGVGLTDRLPGTGAALPPHDPNLRLDGVKGLLEVTTTRSDINTQFQLDRGEYPGVRLSALGFTGREDFEVAAVLPHIPSLAAVGQFGLYAGARSDRVIRGGLISRRTVTEYRQFLANNDGGRDSDSNYVGVVPTGTDVRLTLRRVAGKYSMTVESLSTGAASTLSIRHPAFLDAEPDLYVGLFAANAGSDERGTVGVKEFRVTVWAAGAGE